MTERLLEHATAALIDTLSIEQMLEYCRFHGEIELTIIYPTSGAVVVVMLFYPKSARTKPLYYEVNPGEFPGAIPWSKLLPVLISAIVVNGWSMERER